MQYILEYSEKKGVFHQNNGQIEENEYGWQTLGTDLSDKMCNAFCGAMEEKYSRIGAFENPAHKPPYPKYKVVKREFDVFLFWHKRLVSSV